MWLSENKILKHFIKVELPFFTENFWEILQVWITVAFVENFLNQIPKVGWLPTT